MSTLSIATKGFNSIKAPALTGADYAQSGGDMWMFNQAGGIDYKFSYSGHASSLKALKKCAPLNAIILKKAQAFANGKTWIIDKKAQVNGSEAINGMAKKIRALMAKPNPFQSQKEFEAQQYVYCQAFGFSILLPIKPDGFPNADADKLWNIPPSMLDIDETRKNWLLAESHADIIKSIVISFGNDRAYIPLKDISIIKDFTPAIESPIFPESRICALEMQINNIMGAYESRNVLINYRGALGLLTPETNSMGVVAVNPDHKENLQNEFLRYGLKNNQWKFIISQAALKWQQMGIPTKDLMLFEEIEDDIMRICDSYGYQYELMSSTNGVTFSNKNEAKKLLYQDTIIPEAENICEQWNNFFDLPKYDMEMQKDFSHVPAMQEDNVKKATARLLLNQALRIEYESGLITLNQWLEKLGENLLADEIGNIRSTDIKNTNVPLATIIGVGGVQSLVGVLSAANISEEARSATIQILFGISPENAALMTQGNASNQSTT